MHEIELSEIGYSSFELYCLLLVEVPAGLYCDMYAVACELNDVLMCDI